MRNIISHTVTSGVTTTFAKKSQPPKKPYPFEPTVGQVQDFYWWKSPRTKRQFITDISVYAKTRFTVSGHGLVSYCSFVRKNYDGLKTVLQSKTVRGVLQKLTGGTCTETPSFLKNIVFLLPRSSGDRKFFSARPVTRFSHTLYCSSETSTFKRWMNPPLFEFLFYFKNSRKCDIFLSNVFKFR